MWKRFSRVAIFVVCGYDAYFEKRSEIQLTMKRFVIAGRYVAAVAEQFLDVMERGEVENWLPSGWNAEVAEALEATRLPCCQLPQEVIREMVQPILEILRMLDPDSETRR